MPLYILTGGKQGASPPVAERPMPTLKHLWESYFASLPTGAKEENSLNTEKGHFKHLLRSIQRAKCFGQFHLIPPR